MTILAIENRSDVVKHKESAAILAADTNAYKAHLNKKKAKQDIDERMKSLESRVQQLESLLNTVINQDKATPWQH